MKANPKFLVQPKAFWATIRTISQEVGYTTRGNKRIGTEPSVKIPTLKEVREKFQKLGLKTTNIENKNGVLTSFGQHLFDYFTYRADVLNNTVHLNLMNKDSAEIEFEKLKTQLNPKCPLPMNKQKGAKKNHAFFTGIVNMLMEANIESTPCDYDPRSLTTITHDAMPLRTLSRRIDGAYPAAVNPIAIWEIKEYYYTTTFGSRVADGVYETLLDGMELEELEVSTQRKIQHILFIDDHYTWWQCGRSYLCRIIDMLHMGYVDEVIFGREIMTRLPEMAKEWKTIYETTDKQEP